MQFCILLTFLVTLCLLSICWAANGNNDFRSSCRFAHQYECADFFSSSQIKNNFFVYDEQNDDLSAARKVMDKYMEHVVSWESNFAVAGVGLDPSTLFTFDGHPLNYTTGDLYGSPHTFSAPSKESLHIALLALSLQGNEHAKTFTGGLENTMRMLSRKIKGYTQFNKNFPGFGCFTPWVTFDSTKGIIPLPDWASRVPALDNGEWFWSLYAVAHLLETKYSQQYPELTTQYKDFVQCQRDNVKTIFYRGQGQVSAVVQISDVSRSPSPELYSQEGSGLLDDPYEGETVTQMLYLFSSWENNEEREMLWEVKRKNLQAVNYTVSAELLLQNSDKNPNNVITVQRG
jgi:hypothetical protein